MLSFVIRDQFFHHPLNIVVDGAHDGVAAHRSLGDALIIAFRVDMAVALAVDSA